MDQKSSQSKGCSLLLLSVVLIGPLLFLTCYENSYMNIVDGTANIIKI
jgi:hypothetical protein